jgi:hypothetical protein
MFAQRNRLIILLATWVLLLAACNLPRRTDTPTTDPNLAYTQANQTVAAQLTEANQTVAAQLTQAAMGTPVIFVTSTSLPGAYTPTSTFLPTNTPIPSPTSLPSATPIPPTATEIPIPCDRAGFDGDISVPDNTEIPAGTTFVKTWRLRNTGSCTWTTAYQLVFYSGDAMSGPASSQLTTGSVPPGSTVDVSITLIAPTTPGAYHGEWRLRNTGGTTFGIGPGANESFWVQIISVTPRTPTPTVTPTPVVTLAFDFIARGPDAQWRNATATLVWGDPADDSLGVAVNVENVRMEDNHTYPRLLATYPQRITDGMIAGRYPNYTIQTNDHFRAMIGLRDNCDTGRVRFQVRYYEGDSSVLMGEWVEACDDALATIDINLAAMAGRTVQFELVVLTEGPSDNDISLWVAPRIER